MTVGRLIPYKRIDLVVDAFRELELPRQDRRRRPRPGASPGPGDAERGVSRAGWTTTTLRDLYANCRGFLFPGEEDFGIAPVEAQAAGKPVIAYAAGGALDTVIDGETGVHFARQTPADLADAVRRFESLTFDPDRIRQNAQRFSSEVFRDRFSAFVERAHLEWRANLASETVPHT